VSSIEGPAAVRRPVRKERPAPVTRTVTRYDAAGTELGQVTLEASIFGIEPNVAVLHQVVTAQLAAARSGTHSTKTRAETRGGGAKPFRQKGMGRSRQGSLRAPQYSGGGVALGPKPRSYRQHTPKKMVRMALASALSDRAADGRIVLVDHWPWERPRTKDAVAALEALDLGGRVLAVLSRDDAVADRSFSNLKEVDTILQSELSAYDVLRSDWVVFTDATLPGGGAEVPSGPATTETAATEATTVEAGEPVSEPPSAEETPAEETLVTEEKPVDEEGEDA
jgi:large subunit ribosomal protein L4